MREKVREDLYQHRHLLKRFEIGVENMDDDAEESESDADE